MLALSRIQQWLQQQNYDGWLLYDFRRTNPLACQVLNIAPDQLLTRRFFYWIPKQGVPVKLVNQIENPLKHLEGETQGYASWKELHEKLKSFLQPGACIVMEYSPNANLPTVSKVDAGTIGLICQFGVKVESSAHLLQSLNVLTLEQCQLHLEAADCLDRIAAQTWSYIRQALQENRAIDEYRVQQFILEQLETNNCETSDAPICAVNEHSADPHYAPSSKDSRQIQLGDWILIDLWGRKKFSHAVYADITRVGVAGDKPSQEQQHIFNLVRQAQLQATKFVQEAFASDKPICGFEVDRVARDVIEKGGYGPYFIHRTGHSVDTADHGSGANIDDLETHDDRNILPGTCFSIEPGIYLPGQFGVRLEYTVLVTPQKEVLVTGGWQDSIECLFPIFK